MLVFLAWITLNDVLQGIHRKSEQCSHLPLDHKFQQSSKIPLYSNWNAVFSCYEKLTCKIPDLVVVLCEKLCSMELRQGMVLTEAEMIAHFRLLIVFTSKCTYVNQAFCRCFADLLLSLETQKSDPFVKQRVMSCKTWPVYIPYMEMESKDKCKVWSFNDGISLIT